MSAELTERLAHQGWAVVPALSPAACAEVVAGWDTARFRKAVVMARHGFGRGEYRYYDDPLPPLIQALRDAWYPRLVPIARGWADELGLPAAFPDTADGLREACARAGQPLSTPLLLRYGPGDYNRLHQDLYGPVWFPLQLVVLLDRPGVDFEGGELVLVEQRPRIQSRPIVVPLRQGEAAIVAGNLRPDAGPRGPRRAVLRHGVSEVRAGRRHALGVLFHGAAT
ncbi:MAG: 2OG-Fe(II) oxygenase [Myxococcota bacterium]